MTGAGACRWLSTGGGRMDLFDGWAILIDFRYSDGLINVSVSDGDGNFGGMKGRAICLLSKMCLLLPPTWPLLTGFAACCWSACKRKDSINASPMSAGRDIGRFKQVWPVWVTNREQDFRPRFHFWYLSEKNCSLTVCILTWFIAYTFSGIAKKRGFHRRVLSVSGSVKLPSGFG